MANFGEPVFTPPRPDSPTPDSGKKKPPPLPPSARRKKEVAGGTPEEEITQVRKKPPLPPSARRESVAAETIDYTASETHEPGEFQERDTVDAFEIQGFKGFEVAATLEKKDKHKTGAEQPGRNEDNILADPRTGLIGVMDGLGGEGKGDLASKGAEVAIPKAYEDALKEVPRDASEIAKRLTELQIKKVLSEDPKQKTAERVRMTQAAETMLMTDPRMAMKALALMEAFQKANEAVKESGGKTTASVGMIHETPDGKKFAIVANVGDGAAFKRRANGELLPLTVEDNLLRAVVEKGFVTQEQVRELQATASLPEGQRKKVKLGSREFDYLDLKHAVTGSLGQKDYAPSLTVRQMEPGDELLFASDGLTDKYETPTGDFDIKKVESLFQRGFSHKDNLNRIRKEAKATKSAAKSDDDIAILSARVM